MELRSPPPPAPSAVTLRWVLGKEREFSGRARTGGLACSGGGPGRDSEEEQDDWEDEG